MTGVQTCALPICAADRALGVELGQLSVITLAYLLVGLWWKNKPWYHQRIVRPLSALIAAVGCYWTVQRVFG